MDRLLYKLLEMWISIPRIWRMTLLTSFTAVMFIYWFVKGFTTAIDHFSGLTLPTIIIVAFITAFIILAIFNKNNSSSKVSSS